MIANKIAAFGRAILPESVRRALRGNRNSVKNRFYDDPKQRLSLWWHYKQGGSYIEWYSRRLNRANKKDTMLGDGISDKTAQYLESGKADAELLKKFGMKPDHRLHEIGCGHGRSTRFFVTYLEPEKFTGNDITAERVRFATELLHEHGLDEKKARLYVNKDNSFDWLEGEKVDFLFANAVFGHMPDDGVEDILTNIKKAMRPDSQFLFTWRKKQDEQIKRRTSVKDWLRNEDFWERLAAKHGFVCEHVSEYLPEKYTPSQAALTKFTLAPGK